EAWRLLRAACPIVLALAHASGLAIAQARSMLRWLRIPLRVAASGLVVNAIVIDGCPLRIAVPDGNGACSLRLEHDLADRVAHKLGDASPRPGRSLAQGVEFFLAQISLSFFHKCHFILVSDIRQAQGVPGSRAHSRRISVQSDSALIQRR